MAGEATIGALRVVLGADIAKFEDNLKKAVKSLDSFAKRALEVATGIQLQKGLESTARALLNFGKNAIDTADDLSKLSQKVGIPVEQLSGLKHAAELSDVSVESLARGFKNLALEMSKAQSGSITPASAAFQALGLDINKFGGDANKAFLALSQRISLFDDGMAKTAVTAAIFGKKFGPDLIPLLNQGKKGIEDTIESARKLGLIISTETAKSAETFNDRMKDLKSAVLGIALTALEPLAAGFARLATSLVEFTNRTGLVQKAAEGLVRGIILVADNLKVLDTLLGVFLAKLVITAVINFALGLVSLARAMATATLAVALMNLASLVTVARFAALATIIALVTGTLPTFTDALGKVGKTIAEMMPPDTAKTILEGLDKIGVNTEALTKDLKALSLGFVDTDNAIDGVVATMARLDALRKGLLFDPEASKQLGNFNAELRKISLSTREVSGEFTGKLAPGFIQAAQSLKLIKEDGSNLEAILNLTTDASKRLNDALFRLDAAKLTQEFLTPWQLYEEQLKRINAELARNPEFAETASKAGMKAAVALATSWGEAAHAIVSPMASAFRDLASMNKKYAGAAKAAAIAEALVNTYLGATKAFTATVQFGVPLAIAAAAVATAAGLANVAKISATEFASGGSFKVGGVGGTDSQLMQFMATPGEMVDVRRPGREGQPSGGVQTIQLSMPSPRDFFASHVRDLVDTLNKAAPDGYILKVPA